MGLTLSQRQAVTVTIATRYKQADKAAKGVMLDELCATTGWHRNHARKALAQALRPKIVGPCKSPEPRYGLEVIAALAFCWAVLDAPTGKRLAPIMAELVPRLRHFNELDVSDQTAALLAAMSPATIDRRLAGDRQDGAAARRAALPLVTRRCRRPGRRRTAASDGRAARGRQPGPGLAAGLLAVATAGRQDSIPNLRHIAADQGLAALGICNTIAADEWPDKPEIVETCAHPFPRAPRCGHRPRPRPGESLAPAAATRCSGSPRAPRKQAKPKCHHGDRPRRRERRPGGQGSTPASNTTTASPN
jgi:hypothetical protein